MLLGIASCSVNYRNKQDKKGRTLCVQPFYFSVRVFH
ncbi:Uncharacterised protein [Vibrio cholerae]|uniref:Uncharacterized protein n=2 Tax=Vibrio cholerae TaxID=666 RepID=Q9KQL6_VIBCH|nr:hypothetical protein VC_1982 [Vibrio cholerae O1 biovar El Tor str. N16961]ACP06209.1 conserved hypothetical protein [Vibrio cholerae M66-2]ACP10089.1 conserved hypothetical protein [Vibrio cholerae O395]EEO16742.1 hypothetical protein VCE_003245 [Vibrio cholerae B33]EEO20355.1 hypothetical protein VCF_003159 [Vibrio cholerae BX 330286]CSB74010.1 Uncharacterised protein [Vibrio cholerae]